MNEQQIIDQFGRKHDYLRISLTERCNLRCFYCMPAEGIPLRPRSEFMRQEEVFEIAKQFVKMGVKKIRLTGGEPLIRKDAAEIIKGLGKLPIELGITTNGILVDRFIDTFKEAGLKSVNVSLDSLKRKKQERISRRDYFDQIMSNINLLVEEGFQVKVNLVLMKGVNDDEIVDFIEWTKEMPIVVRFIEFMPFDGNKWDWSKGVSFKELMTHVNRFYYPKEIEKIEDHPNDTSKNYRIKGFKGSFAVISSVTNPFCDTCNRIRLTADGKLKNCLFSNSETHLLEAYRNGDDIKPLILSSIWKKKEYRSGMDTFEKLSDPSFHGENRSMITIGG